MSGFHHLRSSNPPLNPMECGKDRSLCSGEQALSHTGLHLLVGSFHPLAAPTMPLAHSLSFCHAYFATSTAPDIRARPPTQTLSAVPIAPIDISHQQMWSAGLVSRLTIELHSPACRSRRSRHNSCRPASALWYWRSPWLLPERRKNIGFPRYLPSDLQQTQSLLLLSPEHIGALALRPWAPLPETVRPHVARYNSSPLPG